tara:strand:- start:45 stop:224 length:180 start_codon:yes stop_codon:yes gene_type:complete
VVVEVVHLEVEVMVDLVEVELVLYIQAHLQLPDQLTQEVVEVVVQLAPVQELVQQVDQV